MPMNSPNRFCSDWGRHLLGSKTGCTKEIHCDGSGNPSLVTRDPDSSEGLNCLWMESSETELNRYLSYYW